MTEYPLHPQTLPLLTAWIHRGDDPDLGEVVNADLDREAMRDPELHVQLIRW